MKYRDVLATLGLCCLSASASQAQVAARVTTVTYLDAREISAGAASGIIRRYIRAARDEPGSQAIDGLQELGRQNRFVLVEHWQDEAALQAHDAAPAATQLGRMFVGIARAPADRRVTHDFAIDPRTPVQHPALYVVTHVDVPGAARRSTELLLSSLAQRAQHSAGNLRFDIFQQNEPRLNHFEVVSEWSSAAGFDAASDSAAWLEFREGLAPLLGALYDERLYRLIEAQ